MKIKNDTNTQIGVCGLCATKIDVLKHKEYITKAYTSGNGNMLYFGWICPDCGTSTDISYSSDDTKEVIMNYLSFLNIYNKDVKTIFGKKKEKHGICGKELIKQGLHWYCLRFINHKGECDNHMYTTDEFGNKIPH